MIATIYMRAGDPIMQVTKQQLKQLIKEELENTISEEWSPTHSDVDLDAGYGPGHPNFPGNRDFDPQILSQLKEISRQLAKLPAAIARAVQSSKNTTQ